MNAGTALASAVFFHRQAPEDLPALRHVGNPGMHPLVRFERGDGLAFPLHVAFLDGQQAHQALEQGGFADAVSAQQARDLTDADGKRQPAQDVAAAVELMQFFNLQHVCPLLTAPLRAR